MPKTKDNFAKVADADDKITGDNFLSRWSRLKDEARAEKSGEEKTALDASATPKVATLGDADMPPLESLGENSDVRDFFSPGVSEELRRRALRKIFRLPRFNIRDGLDDYDDDFSTFIPLGDIITADMKNEIERLKEKVNADSDQLPKESAEEKASADSQGDSDSQGHSDSDSQDDSDSASN